MAALAARSGALVQVRRVPELRLHAVVGGVAARVERPRPELAALVHRVKIEAELRLAVRAEQALLAELHHALPRLEAGAGGLHALANELHRSEERRVGKECRSRCAPYPEKKK